MNMAGGVIDFRQLCASRGTELYRPAPNELHFLVREAAAWMALCRELEAAGAYLVLLAANDERELEDRCFKLYYLFSHPTADLFLIIENPLPIGEETYPSIRPFFAAVIPFEQKIADLWGLFPREVDPASFGGRWLHRAVYPPGLYPLRRDRTDRAIRAACEQYRGQSPPHAADRLPELRDGEYWLSVGPIHGGVIESGRFLFRFDEGWVKEILICLGYTHRGLERLFQTRASLESGGWLAERITGDSCFAHSLAYSRAVERLAGIELPPEVGLLRGLFLELERIANHIGDCAALAHEAGIKRISVRMAALRERLLRLCRRLAGHRFLRGVNFPGGLVLPEPLDGTAVRETVREVADAFSEEAETLIGQPEFRNRLQWVGILTAAQVRAGGTVGLAARASGVPRDFRLSHPFGPYDEPAVRAWVEWEEGAAPDSIAAREATAGDSLARFRVRVREVAGSARIIDAILARSELKSSRRAFRVPLEIRPEHNFRFGIGTVEDWRGPIVAWLMQDKFGGIYHYTVCDPSLLNWPALKAAIDPHRLDPDYMSRYRPPDDPLPLARLSDADFPIVNKSFNLSYSGHDL